MAPRVKMQTVFTGALGVMLWFGGCAAGNNMGGPRINREQDFDLGQPTPNSVQVRTPMVLQLNGYTIYRQESSPSGLVIETHWLQRDLFDDETTAGATAAKTRIIIRVGPSRRANEGKMVGFPYIPPVWMVAENKVYFLSDTTGGPTENSDEFRAYMQKIAKELKTAYKSDAMRL